MLDTQVEVIKVCFTFLDLFSLIEEIISDICPIQKMFRSFSDSIKQGLADTKLRYIQHFSI